MPITSNINNKEHYIDTKCSDMVTLEDFLNYLDVIWTNPDLHGYEEIFDATLADISLITYADLLTIAEKSSRLCTFDPESKVAIVISSQDQAKLVEFYITAKNMLPAESRKMKIFYNMDEATQWLNNE